MAVFLCSYATPSFYKGQKTLEKSALKNGVDHVLNFNNLWLSLFASRFIIKNWRHFRHSKGAGYWVWKPYIILKCLERLDENDFLVYLDSGIKIVQSIEPLLPLCEQNNGILLFSTFYFENKDWTKRDIFFHFDCDNLDCHHASQLEGGMIVLKKNESSISLISQWFDACQQYHLINDRPNKLGKPDFPSFKAHRHDQSLLSILARECGIEIFRSPHQFTNNLKTKQFRQAGEYLDSNQYLPEGINGKYAENDLLVTNSPYGTLFFVHRNRNTVFATSIFKIMNSFWQDACDTQEWLKDK